MYSSSKYLLSGATSVSTGSVSVLGMDKFSVSIQSSPQIGISGILFPATGTISINSRLDGSSSYVPIYRVAFNNNSGVLTQFDGPMESLQAVLNPFTTGAYTVVVRHSSSK